MGVLEMGDRMTDQVLILGGTGRIGSKVAADLLDHTSAQVTIAGRNLPKGEQKSNSLGDRVRFLGIDLADLDALRDAIAQSNVVVHCAGPFHYRDASVLQLCIAQGVNYVDVSDHPSFTRKALEYRAEATAAGVTAVVNTGIFPGISNSMVRQGVEQLDEAKNPSQLCGGGFWGRRGDSDENDFSGVAASVCSLD